MQTGFLLTPASAAPSISIVVSALGFGAFPSVAPGSWVEIYGSNLAPHTRLQILFGSTPAKLSYDGLAPSLVGLYQFNAIVLKVSNNNLLPLS